MNEWYTNRLHRIMISFYNWCSNWILDHWRGFMNWSFNNRLTIVSALNHFSISWQLVVHLHYLLDDICEWHHWSRSQPRHARGCLLHEKISSSLTPLPKFIGDSGYSHHNYRTLFRTMTWERDVAAITCLRIRYRTTHLSARSGGTSICNYSPSSSFNERLEHVMNPEINLLPNHQQGSVVWYSCFLSVVLILRTLM